MKHFSAFFLRISSNNILRVLWIMTVGMISSQLIATIQVYVSNISLLKKSQLLLNLGYLVIPNQTVMMTLDKFSSAFWGGIFFVLSIGAGVTILSFVFAWIWICFFNKNKAFINGLIILDMALLFFINIRGWVFGASMNFIMTPVIVFWACDKWLPESNSENALFNVNVHVVPICILAALWMTQMSENMFLDLRDNFLMNNSFGYRVNTFYYDYTLYPAEVFKSLDQKLIKTADTQKIQNVRVRNNVRRILNASDYVEIDGNMPPDLSVSYSNHELKFSHHSGFEMTVPESQFLSGYKKILLSFSDKVDRYKNFRKVTIVFLLFGFPIILYIFLSSIVYLTLRAFLSHKKAAIAVSLLTFIFGISLLAPVYKSARFKVEKDKIQNALSSENELMRVLAIKEIIANGMNITTFSNFKTSLNSSWLPEQYWAIRAIGKSRQKECVEFLIPLLDSPHINIVCQSYYALGMLKEKQVVPEIVKRIQTSTHWYEQFYAYHALRRLSWKQRILN